MKHSILGAGNLGIDLYLKLKEQGHEVTVYSRRHPEGVEYEDYVEFDYPSHSPRQVMRPNPDVIWCTLGHGSVEASEIDFHAQMRAHVGLPLSLIEEFKSSRIVLFSTDYLCGKSTWGSQFDTPRSLYAAGKWTMEYLAKLAGGNRVAIFRVGALYGVHKPQSTFPGKILLNKAEILEVPRNIVVPTPTEWLAEVCFKEMGWVAKAIGSIHICPRGSTPLFQWARGISPKKVLEADSDPKRPLVIDGPVYDSYPTWSDLWEIHWPKLRNAMFDQGRITEDNLPCVDRLSPSRSPSPSEFNGS